MEYTFVPIVSDDASREDGPHRIKVPKEGGCLMMFRVLMSIMWLLYSIYTATALFRYCSPTYTTMIAESEWTNKTLDCLKHSPTCTETAYKAQTKTVRNPSTVLEICEYITRNFGLKCMYFALLVIPNGILVLAIEIGLQRDYESRPCSKAVSICKYIGYFCWMAYNLLLTPFIAEIWLGYAPDISTLDIFAAAGIGLIYILVFHIGRQIVSDMTTCRGGIRHTGIESGQEEHSID